MCWGEGGRRKKGPWEPLDGCQEQQWADSSQRPFPGGVSGTRPGPQYHMIMETSCMMISLRMLKKSAMGRAASPSFPMAMPKAMKNPISPGGKVVGQCWGLQPVPSQQCHQPRIPPMMQTAPQQCPGQGFTQHVHPWLEFQPLLGDGGGPQVDLSDGGIDQGQVGMEALAHVLLPHHLRCHRDLLGHCLDLGQGGNGVSMDSGWECPPTSPCPAPSAPIS